MSQLYLYKVQKQAAQDNKNERDFYQYFSELILSATIYQWQQFNNQCLDNQAGLNYLFGFFSNDKINPNEKFAHCKKLSMSSKKLCLISNFYYIRF